MNLSGTLSKQNRGISGTISKQNVTLSGTISQVSDHSILSKRDAPDQHPILAITGLQDILDELNDKIYEPVTFSLVSNEDTITIFNTAEEIQEAIESGGKVTFSQELDDEIRDFDFVGADWENGSIILQNSEGGTIRTVQLHYNGEQMTGDIIETTLITSNMEFVIYCGTATEVI